MDLTASSPKPPATPVPQRSLNQQVVLEEDEYTAALSRIIARDFFPSLVHLDATNGYLDALDSRDPHLINASVRLLQEVNTPATKRRAVSLQTPSQTPYGVVPSETPFGTPRGEAANKRLRYDTDLSLDDFQARYTSEDNASFTRILDDENRKRKEQWAWAWDAQTNVEGQRKKMLERRERMLIEAPSGPGVREKFMIEIPKPAGFITDGREAQEGGDKKSDEDGANQEKALIVTESSAETVPVDVMAPLKDTRSAGVDGWKFRARNSLMFPPDADVSPYDPSTTQKVTDANPKIIRYNNTSLSKQNHPSPSRPSSAPPSPTRSRIDAAIAGTPYHPRSSTTNNFSLVPNMPSPTPSELGPTVIKQLMTWGTLDATPRVIFHPDEPAHATSDPSFHISAPSTREQISHKLSNKASKSLREKAGLLGLATLSRTPGTGRTSLAGKKEMAPPSWTPRKAEVAGNLTPAARKLLDRTTMGTAAVRRAEAMAKAAGWECGEKGKETDLSRVRWTPTPSSGPRKG